VIDAEGRPILVGTLTLCPVNASCRVYSLGAGGRVHVERDLLLENSLTILISGAGGGPPVAAAEWSPADEDRALLVRIPHRIIGRVQSVPPHGVELTFVPDAGDATVVGDPPSRWLVGAGAVWLLGSRFGSDDEALGLGLEVSAGPMVMVGRRLGLPPRWPQGRPSVSYVELTLSYAMNRYTADTVGSDLTFHRFYLAAGVGWAWRQASLVLQGVVGYGGVYDGTTVLERAGRRYAMPAIGATLRGTRHLATLGGVGVGLLGQASLVYHGADATQLDHWHGFAPALRVGLVTN
jgi:hypothetical protein